MSPVSGELFQYDDIQEHDTEDLARRAAQGRPEGFHE